MWDKDGHEVQFIDYNSPSSTNDQRGFILRDSILYLSGRMNGGGTFGNHTLPAGEDRAYVLKYVDTFFATPYVYVEPDDTTNHGGGEVRITVVDPSQSAPLVLVSYPNPFRQRVTIEVQGEGKSSGLSNSEAENIMPLAETAWLTDLTGHREQVRLIPSGERKTESGERVYTLDLSGRPQATYLLTLTTASGKTHTIRLMKMSDIFTR